MTLNQLKANRTALVSQIKAAPNAKFADGTTETVKAAIVAANLKRLKRQLSKVNDQIAVINGTAQPKQKRGHFEQSVLPANFKLA
jgi:hypothetical protein